MTGFTGSPQTTHGRECPGMTTLTWQSLEQEEGRTGVKSQEGVNLRPVTQVTWLQLQPQVRLEPHLPSFYCCD